MRRAILAVTLGGLLLTGTACDSDAESTGAVPAPQVTPPSTAPTSPPPDYTADTRKICGELQEVFDDGIADFGTEIGIMIANKESKKSAEADAAEKAAATRLRSMARNIRKRTEKAQDPAVKTAGATSAAKFDKAATDTRFYDSIKTEKDFDQAIKSQLGQWLAPVSGYCA